MTELTLQNIIINFIANYVIGIFNIVCWYNCFNKSKKNNWIKILLLAVLMSTLITIFVFILPKPLKMIVAFFTLIFICYTFITKQLKQSIILVMISQLIIWLAECSFMIIVLLLNLKNIENITTSSNVFLLLNLYITIISFILLKLKLPQKFYKILINSTKSIKNNATFISSFIVISITIISSAESYMKLPTTAILITNVVMAVIFITIVITSSKIKANYNKISKKYQTSISSLKEYEVMIDKFGVYTHENKNEINTIRNMIKDNIDKDEIIKHIDVLLKNKIKDNAKIMQKTSKIPSGGLRATIYSKLCLMDKLKIKYILNISREVKTTDLINLDEDLTLKICNILGVFLDNAIEAVKELKKKEISIEMYIIDKWLCIDVINNFKGNLDLSKISEVKYTTKGKGHGYGLSLVQEILNEEPKKLKNEKSINRDTFTQTLKIKM